MAVKSALTRGTPIGEIELDARRIQQRERSLETATLCAQLADDYRGRDTLILDLTQLTPIVDFFVITTGTSGRQMHAIAEEINRAVKATGQKRLGREGFESNTWLLLDFGDVVVHVFNEEARARYDLEHLWADAPRIEWQPERSPASESDTQPSADLPTD